MKLLLYQSYYSEDQLPKLDPVFIPYPNLENKTPHLREYPQWIDLWQRHRGDAPDTYWGLLSWRWMDKTGVPPEAFRNWILTHADPTIDCYHIDPFFFGPHTHKNLWVQGDIWVPGMLDFCDKLFPKLCIDTNPRELQYRPDGYLNCNYYIGNVRFWDGWMGFLETCLKICDVNPYLYDYLYTKGHIYNGSFVPNFPFVTERLSSLYVYLNPNLKMKRFE